MNFDRKCRVVCLLVLVIIGILIDINNNVTNRELPIYLFGGIYTLVFR